MKMEDCRGPKATLDTPCVRRAVDTYLCLAPDARAEILQILKVKYAMTASPEVMALWRDLPGLPDQRQVVFAAIKKSAKSAEAA